MTRQLIADKKESSLGELIVIILLIAAFMATFIHYFFKQEQQFSDTGFTILAHKFSATVVSVHAQWYMDKKPNIVMVITMDGQQQRVSVNDKGWINSISAESICQKIWQTILEEPLVFIKEPVSAVEIKRKSEQKKSLCRYGLPSGHYFDYDLENGKVSHIRTKKTKN